MQHVVCPPLTVKHKSDSTSDLLLDFTHRKFQGYDVIDMVLLLDAICRSARQSSDRQFAHRSIDLCAICGSPDRARRQWKPPARSADHVAQHYIITAK